MEMTRRAHATPRDRATTTLSDLAVVLTDDVIFVSVSNNQMPSTPDSKVDSKSVLDPTNPNSNHITVRGIVMSIIFITVLVLSMFTEQYLNLIPIRISIDDEGNEYSEHMEGKHALFICLGPALFMFITYFAQSRSIFNDVPRRHIYLIILHQIMSVIRDLFRLWAIWSIGILMRSMVNVMPVMCLVIAEKFVFRKALFYADSLGTALVTIGTVVFLPVAVIGFTEQYLEGLFYQITAAIFGTLTNLLAEYICKIDYGQDSNRSSMNPAFWIGINGLIAFPLYILLILCSFSFQLAEIIDFGSKLLENQLLISLYICSAILIYVRLYSTIEIIIRVSSVALQSLILYVMIPVFIMNLFVNPIESMGYNPWIIRYVIVSLLLSTFGILVYYEIVVPKQWQRKRA